MNIQQFEQHLKQKTEALKKYTMNYFPARAGNVSLRFINGNFRAQGWQGGAFMPWKANRRKGTVLVKKGKLRAATTFTTQPGQVRVMNNMPYAKAHNEGFNGTVNVQAHTRHLYEKKKVAAGGLTKIGKPKMKTVTALKGTTQVKAHARKMNLPKRQFMPTSSTDSPVLAKALTREVERELNNIFK